MSENQTAFRRRGRSHHGIKLGGGAVRLRGVAAAGVGDFGPVGWTLEETAALELEGRTLTIRSTEASGLIIDQLGGSLQQGALWGYLTLQLLQVLLHAFRLG